jgi:hypothetical protein
MGTQGLSSSGSRKRNGYGWVRLPDFRGADAGIYRVASPEGRILCRYGSDESDG